MNKVVIELLFILAMMQAIAGGFIWGRGNLWGALLIVTGLITLIVKWKIE